MNQHSESNTEPGTEARVIAAMRSLAESHEPRPEPASSTRSSGSRRWLLGAAAAAMLVVGVGALLVAANRDTDGTADRLPEIDPTTIPISLPTTVTAADVTTATTDTTDSGGTLLSSTPLSDDILPVLDPAPSDQARAFEFSASFLSWTAGIENLTAIAIVEGNEVVGSVQAFDSAAPWSVLSNGQDVVEIDGRQAIRLDLEDDRGVFVRMGNGVRGILDGSFSGGDNRIDSAIDDLVVLLGDGPLDTFVDTPRFVRLPLVDGASTSVSYGEPNTEPIQLVLIRLDVDPTPQLVDIVTQLYLRPDPARPQSTALVQVSPRGFVIITAPDPAALEDARENLRLVPADDSGVDVSANALSGSDDVIARGEPAWGRWQVTTVDDQPACRFFELRIWDLEGKGRRFVQCDEDGRAQPTEPWVSCARFDLEVVGVVLGTANRPEFAVGTDIDGLVVEREDTEDAASFRIAQAEPGANVRAATVLVDGVPIECDG